VQWIAAHILFSRDMAMVAQHGPTLRRVCAPVRAGRVPGRDVPRAVRRRAGCACGPELHADMPGRLDGRCGRRALVRVVVQRKWRAGSRPARPAADMRTQRYAMLLWALHCTNGFVANPSSA
jgi:hypothetical protein